MTQEWTNGRKSKYHTLELRAQRPFFSGCRCWRATRTCADSRQEFYDNVDEYDEVWTWTDVPDPRHRLNVSLVWDVPVGRDRKFGSGMNSALDAVVGGWELAGTYRYESGQYLRFGGMIAPTETPKTLGNVGAGNYWFDTTGFRQLPAFTRRDKYMAVRRPQGTELQERRPRALEARAPQGDLEAQLPPRSV